VCTFLVGNDEVGREAIERLTQRARAGVRVRLMIDAAGAWLQRPPSLRELCRAGGHVAYFSPLWTLSRRMPRNLRNHRKLVIADDRRLWAGGRNLAAEYFEGGPGHAAWIDLSCDLAGAPATSAAYQFARDWSAASRQALREIVSSEPVGTGGVAQFVPSGPDQAEDTIHTLLLAACFHARTRIVAVTPYFVPDDGLLEALRLAVLRGVELTLVLPARSNHRLADFARGRALRTLTQAGAHIRLVSRMVHAKAVIVDDSLGWCGSANLDSRSLLINYESVLVFYEQREILWLAKWVESLGAGGSRFEPRPVGLARDIAEGLLLTVAFQI
jgi:cardiolipin synthase A/B